MEGTPSPQGLTVKLVCMVLLLMADLIINSFVECSFSQSWLAPLVINFYFIPIQIVITLLSLIMVLVMMWATFPLRYGLVGTLFVEFKYTFIVFVLFFRTECSIQVRDVVCRQGMWYAGKGCGMQVRDVVCRQGMWYAVTTAVERGVKLALLIQGGGTELSIWRNGFYVFMYFLRYLYGDMCRFLSYPVFYGFMVMFGVRIMDGSLYRPERWLK